MREIHRSLEKFPAKRPVTRCFDIFLDLVLNKRLSKKWWGWWFETPSGPIRRHYNDWFSRNRSWCIYVNFFGSLTNTAAFISSPLCQLSNHSNSKMFRLETIAKLNKAKAKANDKMTLLTENFHIWQLLQPIHLSNWNVHYGDVIMGAIASQITNLTIVYLTVYSDAEQRKHHSSASLAFVWGIHRGQVNSMHKWPVTRKMFPFDDVITD